MHLHLQSFLPLCKLKGWTPRRHLPNPRHLLQEWCLPRSLHQLQGWSLPQLQGCLKL
jgi:hypothetical protein